MTSGKGNSGVPEKKRRGVLVSASLMCADVLNLEREVQRLEALGVDLLHFDIMDAHFVPNMPMGLGVLAALRAKCALPFDVHLMVEDSDWFIGEVGRIGVERIAVHAESCVHLDRTLALIRRHGSQAGIALNPATPLAAMEYGPEQFDFVLLMTVTPGFAGQKLVPSALGKIADCREFLRRRGVEVPIAVDGNVSFENIPKMVAAGADVLVGGSSSLFHGDGSLEDNMRRLRAAACCGLEKRDDGAAKGKGAGGRGGGREGNA